MCAACAAFRGFPHACKPRSVWPRCMGSRAVKLNLKHRPKDQLIRILAGARIVEGQVPRVLIVTGLVGVCGSYFFNLQPLVFSPG